LGKKQNDNPDDTLKKIEARGQRPPGFFVVGREMQAGLPSNEAQAGKTRLYTV
jgi:hypothetical protein